MTIIKHTSDITDSIYQDALKIRMTVFVEEQAVPHELEIEDEEICVHCVLYTEEGPQATVRLYPLSDGRMKIQRVAVLKSARRKGYGQDIMTYSEELASSLGAKEIILGAQLQAIPFYESMGYVAHGETYLDADIEHKDMSKSI